MLITNEIIGIFKLLGSAHPGSPEFYAYVYAYKLIYYTKLNSHEVEEFVIILFVIDFHSTKQSSNAG